MLLNQLVRINEAGIVADSVNFGLMEEQETNQKLCEGFVFNYDKDKPEESTIGVLEALRSSYDSRNHANVHLLVQQYGKGKSHFAVAIANYFSKSADSLEVQGILHQIENASGRTSAIAERLRLYKKRGKHLVLCLSGDRSGDIRKHFLQSLLKTLEAEGITNSVAQHICSEPLSYLQRLNADQRERADTYLESIGSLDGDLNSITQQLQKNNPAVIPTLKNLAKHLTGFVPDWNVNLDIEEILKDLITTHCSGETPRFQGVLILFDELNFYLQNWAKDPIGAGGTALQNITNICEAYKGKIALLSFTQVDPAMGIGIPAGALEDHRRLVSRLAPKGSTYQKVASSLELVLDNLLLQDKDTPEWKSFWTTWNDALRGETNNAYEKRITIYKEKGWTRDKFHQVLTIGCFPLHPLTAYLLCNLSFTVDRTALQFIKKEVKAFIQNQPLTRGQADSKLNFIYPIALVDTFLENFADDSNYSKYKEAYSAVVGSDNLHESLVLKALFLYHASSGKLAKTDREPHEEVLSTLTGLSVLEVKTALDQLANTRDVIYYKPEVKLYRFWTGPTPGGIEEEIEEQIKERRQDISLYPVVAFCQSNIEQFLGSKTLAAQHFVETNKLVLADWKFEYKVYTIDSFIRDLNSDLTLRKTEERGFLAYILAETQAELQDFRRRVDALLAKSAIRDRIAVAIPSDETGELAKVLLKIQLLKNKEVAERRSLGAAYEEQLKRWQDQVNTQAENLLKSCTYHCVGLDKIPPAEREKPQRVISVLLKNLYPFVPPIDGIDKLKSGHTTGSKVVGFVSRQLLAENLTFPFPDNTYKFVDDLFVSHWKLLKKTSQRYSAQEPKQERIKAAWDLISKMTELDGVNQVIDLQKPERIVDLQQIWKTLSAPPYGYSEYTFTMLLAGWLSYHRKEVSLKGNATIPPASKKGTASVTVETKSLKDWAATNILEKPDDFVKKWIVTGNAKLIRRKKISPPPPPQSSINYSEAEQYLQVIQTYLEAGEPDPTEVIAITKTRDQVNSGVTRIRDWFQPVEAAAELSDTAPLESLLEIYPKLLSTPPAIIIRDDVISVQPTQQQRDRQAQALQFVGEKIEQWVDAESERSESLPTEEACGAYRAEVQRILTQMNQVSSLPPHLTDTLQYSLQTAERRLLELKEAAKVKDCLSQIQSRYRALGNSPTQQDYLSTRDEIEALAYAVPAVKQEEAYKQILQELDQQFNDLTQQVEIWEEKSLGLDSPDQIHELMGEINGRRYRFTKDESIQKITKLLEYLKRELSRGQSKDDAVKAIKATLSNANRKLERIRDVAANKLSDAFQSYQELMEITLPSVDSSIALEKYQQELEGFKVKGRSALVSEGFAKVYDLELKRLEDYDQLKGSLQQRLNFIARYEDFTDVKASLEQSLQSLEIRYRELQEQHQEQQRQAQDEQIIRSIRSTYKLPKTNTLQFLEDGIREVQESQDRLYDAASFSSEIEQILQSLRDKVANHKRSLEDFHDRLSCINDLKGLEMIQTAHAKLGFVFEGSTEYSAYQSLQQQIQQLRDDLDKLQSLEAQCQQSFSIADCRKVLEAIGNERGTLHNQDRFQQKLTELEGSLQSKLQISIQELEEFEQKLDDLETAKEAKRLHGELLKNSSRYAHSDSANRYETISTNFQLLIDLLQISEAESGKTLEACQAQLEKLSRWNEGIDTLIPSLQERFDAIYQVTEKAKAQILKRQQTDVEKWLKGLENQAAELGSLTDEVEKGKLANRLLQKIQRDQTQYIERLSSSHQDFLKSIEHQCEAEIDKDRENQIKVLFQQLPRSQRVSLYRQLEAYLSDPTEEFNG